MIQDSKMDQWVKEFQTFLKAKEVSPPESVSQKLLAHVHNELNPGLQKVLIKLFGLHMAAASLVTLICPQLGVAPILGQHGIMYLFMVFGPLACAAFCGAFFIGTSALLATVFLKREELRLAYKHRFLNVTLLVSLTFAGLMLIGGQVDQWSYFFWILGAVLGGCLILQMGGSLRLSRQTTLSFFRY